MTTQEKILTYLADHGETRREVLCDECGSEHAVMIALSRMLYEDLIVLRRERFVHLFSLPMDDAA